MASQAVEPKREGCTGNENSRNTILVGAGAGTYVTAGFSVSQCLISPAEIPNITADMSIGTYGDNIRFTHSNTFKAQALGIVLFFSVIGAGFQNWAYSMIQYVLPHAGAEEIHQSLTGTSTTFFNGLASSQREQLVAILTRALKSAWATLIAGGSIGLIMSTFLGVSASALTYHTLL